LVVPLTKFAAEDSGRYNLFLVRRYIDIYSIMLRNSLIREMSFKANFLLWMVVEILWFCGQILFFSIIFGQVNRIGDWSKWEVVLLVGTHQIIAQLFQAFFFVNVANVPELVRTGKLDSLLVLPLDSQFAVSTKQFGLDSVINAVIGAAVVLLALTRLQITPSVGAVLLYLIALGFGVAVHYSIMLSLAAVSFWIIRAQGLVYGYFNFLNIARYPDVIFPKLFRFVFGWIIPVVIVANIPARLLIKSLGQPGWLMLHLIVAGTIAAMISRFFWRFALRHYSSASS
jgi:ABC-2 type transport system permease protein